MRISLSAKRQVRNCLRGLLVLCFAASLCSCVFVPKTVAYYDKHCKIASNYMVLTTEQTSLLRAVGHCSNESCTLRLEDAVVGAIVMVPLSAIVSGSIVLVGNTMFWLQKQGRCIFRKA